MSWACSATVLSPEGTDIVCDVLRAVIYPLAVDLPDIVHEVPPELRVDMPDPRCALCAAGLCVQALDPEERTLVRHGRWVDA